ncbi:MAG TPA: endonuclease/exonuclease/phosphatase family protein [Thermoleophilaceae bacterium]|nr:endonuclease/exonuclease/phosphatase family protein [Thermoleophilaceae bacterium]
MRLITWNVAGRVARQPEQAAALARHPWDVVCLQEVTPTTLKPWRLALQAQGLSDVRSSMDEWLPGEPTPDGRRLGVLTASRAGLEVVASAHVPWPERLLTTRVGEKVPFVLHNLHSPISQKPGHVKIRTHRALHRYLARQDAMPSLLVGDLNTPRREFPDGQTWSFARTAKGSLRLDRGERWDHDELSVLRGLESHGMRDLYRDLHGYARNEILRGRPARERLAAGPHHRQPGVRARRVRIRARSARAGPLRSLCDVGRGDQPDRVSRAAALTVLTTYITERTKNSAPRAARTCSVSSGTRSATGSAIPSASFSRQP